MRITLDVSGGEEITFASGRSAECGKEMEVLDQEFEERLRAEEARGQARTQEE